ncbi:response regulator [Candidatus Pacearchaeota archaeon]|nr:response regulator [Candidatus Pacearchaeota archaeon]
MAGKTKNQDHSPSLSEINKSQDTASNYQSSKKITAIVIDDDLDTLNFFGEYLEIKNVTVLGKGFNGKEAVQLYSKLKPDVVFLDVLMDDYDGFYALERIRWIDPSAKVIMVTADLSTKTEDRLRKLDASAVIYKPYDINQITNEIERLFQQEVCGYVKLH